MKRIAVVSAMSHFSRFSDAFMFSCLKQDIHPIFLTDSIASGIQKTESYYRWIRKDSTKFYSHILFCDSYDVIFQRGMAQIESSYDLLSRPLIVGAEYFCLRHPQYATQFEHTASGLSFPNSGLWIAEREMAESLLASMINKKNNVLDDETGYFMEALLECDLITWAVDSSCVLFMNWQKGVHEMFFDSVENCFRSIHNPGKLPSVIHLPGFTGSISSIKEQLGFPK